MPRYSLKHQCYRTLQEIAQDVAYVLNAPLAYGTKFAVLHNACWSWTEFGGKYQGCPRWTNAAIQSRRVASQNGFKRKFDGLRHEHAVPRSLVIEMLRDLESPRPDDVRQICDSFLKGVVVTKEEDRNLNCMFRKNMPPEFFDPTCPEYHDPFLRYKRCGIEIVEPPDNWWLNIKDAIGD
jgi:hypothetical protein